MSLNESETIKMRNLKITFFLLFLIAFVSCKNQSLKTETEDYLLSIETTLPFHQDFLNELQVNPLNIKAERISLEEVFSAVLQTDTSRIEFENKKLGATMFNVLIQQKNKGKSIHKDIQKELCANFDLKIKIVQKKVFEVTIADSVKFAKFKNGDAKSHTEIIRDAKSIKLTKVELKDLLKYIEYDEVGYFLKDENKDKLDFSWIKMPVDSLKTKIANDLGLTFKASNKKETYFKILNK